MDQAETRQARDLASPPGAAHRAKASTTTRSTVDFLAVVLIGISLARVFVAEAYIVPTGSMAPTLLGMHRDLLCSNCGSTFALGLDEDGRSARPACPNCGEADFANAPATDSAGDRLLVQKHLYEFRAPRRWEVVVFQNPDAPGEAFVKRIVGLPGESLEIRGGDVYINGRVARKSLAEQRGMRQLVYDHAHPPRDFDRMPRWIRSGSDSGGRWEAQATSLLHQGRRSLGVDWIDYHHWQPDRQVPGPVRDFVPYNGVGAGGDDRVDDLMLEAEVRLEPDCPELQVALGYGADLFIVRIPTGGARAVEVSRNGVPLSIEPLGPRLRSSTPSQPRPQRLEASVFDARLLVAIDGELVFEPYDFDDPLPGPPSSRSRLALGVSSGTAWIDAPKVYRDVHYTASPAGRLRPPHAVGTPYSLGPDEFFVLGDNSPVSSDSRVWASGPVVRAESLIGKPFLVHLPSQAVPLKVFGRETYWIPDPRGIRYIR
jgi:signal peptidase I